MPYDENGSEKYNMRIFYEDGSRREREGMSYADYPVSQYHMDMRKMRSSEIHWHWHRELEVVYVAKGCINFMTNKACFECGEDEGIVVNGNVMHNITIGADPDGSFYGIVFAPELIVGEEGGTLWNKYWLPFQGREFQVMKLTRDVAWKSRILDFVETAVRAGEQQRHGYELVIKGALCSSMAVIASQLVPEQSGGENGIETVDEYRVKIAITFIKDHYAESITLGDIAESTNVSKSECCRYFKRTLHITPFEYLMKYRIYSAVIRLGDVSQPAESMSELATSVGFNSISYFNKLFKKYMLCTPTKYRRDMIYKESSGDVGYADLML
jgi:AraC-like DNA-binding protein